MTAPLTTRDALAAALGDVWRSGLPFCPDGGVDLAAFANALLASGALTDAGKLAEDAESWATVSFALARDVSRIKRVCTQEHPPKMGSPAKDWPAGTETTHSDGTRCVRLEDGDCAILSPAALSAQSERAEVER